MRPLTTLVLLSLTALAIGFIVIFERRQPGTLEAAERSQVLLTLGTEEIGKIEITNAAGRVKLERGQGTGWQLTSPVKDRADRTAVETMLQLATATEVVERLTGDDVMKKSRLRELGLDASQQGRVVFYPRGSDAVAVIVGRPAPGPGTVYVQVEYGDRKAEEVLVIRGPWSEPLLARSPGEWRDPRLITATPDTITRFAVHTANSAIELERDRLTDEDKKKHLTPVWRFTKPLAERADQELIADSLLPGLIAARAQSFSEPGSPPVASGSADARVTLWSDGGPPDGEQLEVFAGPDDESVWVQVAGRPGHARAASDLLALRACTLDRLRHPTLAAIDTRRLTTVVIKDIESGAFPIYQHHTTWYLAHDGLVHEANRDRVQGMVDVFNKAMVLEWFDQPGPPADYGLDAPFLEITFGTAIHADRTLPVMPGEADSATLRLGERQKRFYAQWAGKPTVMRFDGSILGSVPREWIRFKSPRLLGFSPRSLRSLTLTEHPSPPLECTFDLGAGATWSARRQETDVTAFLDLQQLERLVSRLSEFEAHDWSNDPAQGLEALQQPLLTIDLVIEQFDDTTDEAKPVPVRLTLAPTAPDQRTALFYGRLNSDPNVFIIRRPLVEALLVPVLKPKPESADN